MQATPFHAYYTARKLAGYANDDSLIPAYASANIEIYPYQIAAARFALRSQYLKGCILCDESSLGKTYELLLIITQKWYEGYTKLLLVLPVNMIGQWVKKLENDFTLPYVMMDTNEAFKNAETENPFEQDGLVITTYEFAVSKYENIKQIKWDAVIFDEADRLNKTHTGENKTASALKAATDGVFRILLTANPIEMSIMDIYGLIYFIDETILPIDPDAFYKYYFRRPDRYPELAEWVSKFCFRTLKNQVSGNVNFTERVPFTIGCDFTKEEERLYNKLQEYIALPAKIAYPEISPRDMGLQHNHILSSSAQACAETIGSAINDLMNMPADESKLNLYSAELETLKEIKSLAETVTINGKTKILLDLLKKCFVRLCQLKTPQKAIVFVDNLTTIKYLSAVHTEQGYGVLTFSGNNSRDYSVIERFRSDKEVQILIAMGGVTKGLDIEFCPVVFNYDLLSNALELEQRISRCHRQGQQADVLVINLFSKYNDADLRYLELINKRTKQFEGIFGLSDMVLGNFDIDVAIDSVLSQLRPANEIQESFTQNLAAHEHENREIVQGSLETLFTTFTKDVADKVAVTPQYITEKSAEINSGLWEVAKWFFKRYNEYEPDPDDFMTKFTGLKKHTCHFEINEQEKTITAHPDEKGLPVLFYYWTGTRNKPYISLKSYGMDKDFKPRHGRITLTSIIGRGVLEGIECADEGTLTVNADISAAAAMMLNMLLSNMNMSLCTRNL